LAFISAVAFTTVVAVVSGLVISSTTAFSHDIYHHLIKKGTSTDKEQLRAAQISAFFIGIISTIFAFGLININVTFLASWTLLVAASSYSPVMLLPVYSKRLPKSGPITGTLTGLITSIIIVAIGPRNISPFNGWIQRAPTINLLTPGIM